MFVIVDTEYGPIKGYKKSSILGMDFFSFQGVPYMKAPIGKLRFRDAEVPDKWTEPFDASHECAFPARDMLTFQIAGKEDAGIVNIYTKKIKPNVKFPVMVWVTLIEKKVAHESNQKLNIDSRRRLPMRIL